MSKPKLKPGCVRYPTARPHLRHMRRAVGEVIYAIRLPDGVIKIGWTADLGQRLHKLGVDSEVLALRNGARADEMKIHSGLADDHRVPGRREYYHPTPEVLAVVNDMRSDLGLDPIVA